LKGYPIKPSELVAKSAEVPSKKELQGFANGREAPGNKQVKVGRVCKTAAVISTG
jgi:hypothetical protein